VFAVANAETYICDNVGEGGEVSFICPDPTQIITSVTFASYGTPSGTCGSFVTGGCNAADSVSIVQSFCIGLNACSFGATNSVFQDPCVGTVKFFAGQVVCETPVCADQIGENEIAIIACPSSNQVITNITFASYGTAFGTCLQYSSNIDCNAADSVSVVQSACLGLNSCSFVVSNDLFTDPCFGTAKYLDAQVECEPLSCANQIPENSQTTLTCPFENQVISSIDFASYGTASGECGSFIVDPSCDSANSVSILQSSCLGQSSCIISVDNTVFTDPCPGTVKYLDAQFSCGPM